MWIDNFGLQCTDIRVNYLLTHANKEMIHLLSCKLWNCVWQPQRILNVNNLRMFVSVWMFTPLRIKEHVLKDNSSI